jgi:hypothetical protein
MHHMLPKRDRLLLARKQLAKALKLKLKEWLRFLFEFSLVPLSMISICVALLFS